MPFPQYSKNFDCKTINEPYILLTKCYYITGTVSHEVYFSTFNTNQIVCVIIIERAARLLMRKNWVDKNSILGHTYIIMHAKLPLPKPEPYTNTGRYRGSVSRLVVSTRSFVPEPLRLCWWNLAGIFTIIIQTF